ncbi:hypothetical protein [Paludibacterium denitrificans]|uniref:Uncharacterized protein n=1 Tax=Paludibacterium denitrificans TaxID=2675226 RepID=A0A844GBN5_9NEIS|nr:hypothetical protein [Paludibacterium denitrificans]MTD33926.1 hypothetical protein [Paludibacterium denitrificans]
MADLISVYVCGSDWLFDHVEQLDPTGPLPHYSTLTPVPPISGSEVAKYQNGQWVVLPERPIKSEVVPDPAPAIPQEVTRFQARGALYQAGLLDKVEAFIAAEGTDMMLKLAWQDAQTFKRYSPFITGVGQQLGLTDKQLDALFVAASLIE